MRLPRPQFTLGRLMIAVAAVALGCWVVVVRPPEVQLLMMLCAGPLAGACWSRLVALKPFDPGKGLDPRNGGVHSISPWQDRFFQSLWGGIKGGVIEAVIIASVVVLQVVRGVRGSLADFMESLNFAISVFFILLAGLAFVGLVAGILVGALAEAVRVMIEERQETA